MPRVTRSRVLCAPPGEIWPVVSDVHHLPRWWPGVRRVEDVRAAADGHHTEWTVVMKTGRGNVIRASHRCTDVVPMQRFAWEQVVEGSPFAELLSSASTTLQLEPTSGGTAVQIEASQRLRRYARLGWFMVRRATGKQLDQALEELERRLARPGRSTGSGRSRRRLGRRR